MYDIRQFRPTLYLLVGIGFTGFCIATLAPLLWVLAMGLLMLNAWLVRNGRFRPFPRWVANGLTILAAAWTGMQILADPRPIFPIGNFLVILQLIKLYEQRANRDYAQLLVLSLLLMVAAAISTASLIFGLIFIVYLLLSPYACLLFHLKVETDHAKRQMGLDEKLANPLTLRQDQRYLNRSMTRLTAFVALGAIVMGVLVFLFFPRVPGQSMLTWQFRPSMAASGLNESMDLQTVTRVQQNTAEIAWLKVTHNGEPVTGGPLYLRGMVFDIYDGDPQSATRWSWERSGKKDPPVMTTFRPGSDDPFPSRTFIDAPDLADQWVQDFTPLKPTGVSFLLALPGVQRISVSRQIKLGYVPSDALVQLDQALYQELTYRVTSSGIIPYETPRWAGATTQPGDVNALRREVAAIDRRQLLNFQPDRSTIDPRILAYARRPDVSGLDNAGKLLADELPPVRNDVSPLTEIIATNIERHLQTQFTYTLDLGNNAPKDSTVDPVVHFLYESRTGWCEHYAYAMTLMCKSLGMKARMVSGYKCDEFNTIGGYFIVRQSHAHAWVEVLVKDGDRLIWKTFDPTSGLDADTLAARSGFMQRVGHFFDYLEHAWANSVVAYDASSQTGLLDNVESKLINASGRATAAARGSGSWFSGISDWFADKKYSISESVIVVLLSVMSVIAVGLTAWYLIERHRLTRRARRIGLENLRGTEARRLARQLGFYDQLTQILEKRNIVREPHLTPLEFGQSLNFLPAQSYRTIVRLTQIFYRIRYGAAELSAGQKRSLDRVMARLQDDLIPPQRP